MTFTTLENDIQVEMIKG
ncbi:DUF1655 domain-containing protein [Lactococcus lactis]